MSTCVALTAKTRASPAKSGSSSRTVTGIVPISRPRGFLATSPPSAWASIWCPKQMPRSGFSRTMIRLKSSSVRSIQGARSVTLDGEPVTKKPRASRISSDGSATRTSTSTSSPG